jgi:predicted permease
VAPEPHDIWVLDGELPTPPFGAADGAERQREVRYLQLVARIRPDVGPDAALQDLRRVAGLLAAEHPDTNRDRGYRLVALADDLTGDVRPGLLMLSGAVGFLLLIACANVGNLALARATTREKEMAVRRALGAGTLRLLRLVVAEQLVVAVAGAALGIVLTLWGLDALLALTPVPLPRADQVRVDAGVVVFGALLAIIAAVAVGVVTTVGRLDDRLDAALRDSTRSTTSSGRQRVRAVLVVAEIALATVLVIGAALLAKSFVRLQAVAPGFEPAGLLTVALPLPQPQYADPAVQHAFYRDVQAGVSRLPGVIGAALAFPLPLSLGGDAYVGIALEGSAYDADAEQRRAGLNWVTPGYFRTMHVRLVAGRDFDERDIAGRRRVAIVNGQMVQRFFGGRDPIGHELQVGQAEEDRLTVVGVVSDVSARRAGDPPQPEVYIPIHQHAFPFMTLLVRTTGAPETAAGPVREVVRRLDPELAVGQVRPYGDVIERTVSQPRFRTWLLLIFGGLALLLAALGIYGVMSYAVSQRIREFGVRLALGAARRDVYLLVLRQGAVLAGAGLALGMALALVLSRALRSMLFEVAPHDPLVLAGVAALLGLVALSACAMPAFRATRVDPLDALRVE